MKINLNDVLKSNGERPIELMYTATIINDVINWYIAILCTI